MPICIRGCVIGVVQMINKKSGSVQFTQVILEPEISSYYYILEPEMSS